MRLLWLEVRDFRAFRHARLELPAAGLVLVAGVTNSGKSALLSAFDVLLGRRVPDPRHVAADGPATVTARFALEPDDRRLVLGTRPRVQELLDQGALAWIELRWTEHDGAWLVSAIRSEWAGRQLALAELVQEGPQNWQLRVIPALDPSRTGVDEADAAPVLGSGAPLTLLGGTNYPGLIELAALHAQFATSVFRFAPYRRPPGAVTGIASNPLLQGDGNNLPQVLLHLKTNQEEAFAQVRAHIERLVPSLGTLQILTTTSNELRVAFTDRHAHSHQEDLADLGAGVAQLVPLLVAGLTQPSRLLLVEEPETNLNPGAQRALLRLLEEWSQTRLIMATTHSATMLDRSVQGARVLVTRRSGNVSELHEVNEDRAEAFRELGVRFSDVLSAERLLVVEGPSDEAILQVWFPELLGRADLALAIGRGGDGALHVDRFAEHVDALDRLAGRSVLYLRDRDELPARLVERFERSPRVHLLARRELENYLLDDYDALWQVLSVEGSTVALDDLPALLREEAEHLREAVVVGRVSWELEPVYPVPHSQRSEMIRTGGGLATFLDVVLPRYPGRQEVEQRIHHAWETAQTDVDARWETEWVSLAPGADLLDRLWRRLLSRGFSKITDGSAVAARARPPEEVRVALTESLFASEAAPPVDASA